MPVHSTESKRYRHFFEWLIYAIFVVPYAQIKKRKSIVGRISLVFR